MTLRDLGQRMTHREFLLWEHRLREAAKAGDGAQLPAEREERPMTAQEAGMASVRRWNRRLGMNKKRGQQGGG